MIRKKLMKTLLAAAVCAAVLAGELLPAVNSVQAAELSISYLADADTPGAENGAPETAAGYTQISVSAADAKANVRVIQEALNEAGALATAQKPYKVVVAPGKYTISSPLRILSNTCLSLEGVTFVQDKNNSTSNMFIVGDGSENEKGYCYENITISGGTFDKNGNKGTTLMKVGHASNFVMENVTMTNITDAHFMEIGGTNGFTMRGCNISNMKLTGKKINAYEAIQFDILVKGHIGGYSFEDLANQNILIENCTFGNVSRGVGSHNTVLNNPIRNIEIKNNTFKDIKSLAIRFVDARNCSITGNTITNTPRAIEMDGVLQEGTFFGSTLNKSSKTSKKYIKPDLDQQITISGNTINCSGKDPDGESPTVCIFLRGTEVEKVKKVKDGDKVPKGEYYVSGVVIADNKLTTSQNAIFLDEAKNTSIDRNQIICKGKTNSDDAVRLSKKSTDNRITGNTIKNASGHAVSLFKLSSAKLIADNKITSPRNSGLYIEGCLAEEITGNTITKPKSIGIAMTAHSNAKKISGNTITSAPDCGINMGGTDTDLVISDNKIKKCGAAQIWISNESTKQLITVSRNTLTGKSDAEGILCTGGNLLVDNNKITSSRFAVLLNDNVKGTIVYNNCSKNQHNGVNIGWGEEIKYLSKPASFKATALNATSVKLSWKKVKGAKGYQIFRSDKPDGTFTKVADIKKTSYKNMKLKKKTTYYYRVVAYQYSANKNIAVASDYSTVSIQTK